ncbi:hypothetical protein AB0I39_07005 [Kitasatospora purpeofusca]|uniref:hypothetical protein n=1 Tax=Kitasatospora purpeofusca TaxID=67352 RepID=UPI0033C7E9A9
MALSTEQIHALAGEVHQVLRPDGVFVYTARRTGDAHFGAGTGHCDDNLGERRLRRSLLPL